VLLKDVQLADLAEMVAVNCKCNSQWEQRGAAKKRPQQELPVMDARLVYNTQAVDGAKEGQDVLKVQWGFDLGRLVL